MQHSKNAIYDGVRLRRMVSEAGRNYVDADLAGLSKAAIAHFRVRLHYFISSKGPWSDKIFKWIENDIGEIKIKADNIDYRLIGFSGPERGDFTVLFVVAKKRGRLGPEVWAKARDRRARVIANPELAHEWPVR